MFPSLDLVQQFAVVAVPVVAHWQDGMVFAGLLVSGLAARRNAETACVKRLACSSSAAAA